MMFLRKIHFCFSDKLGRFSRKWFRNKYERKELKNHNFTILSQICIGSIMYHDLGEPFLSPTINMLFEPDGFIKFMYNIKYYLSLDIKFIDSKKEYPIGLLDDIKIDFVHYNSEDEAMTKWNQRKERIQWDNIFVIACDKDMSEDAINKFLCLNKYPNRILFSSKFIESMFSVYQSDFNDGSDARLLNFCNIFGKRFYQKWINYTAFLNKSNEIVNTKINTVQLGNSQQSEKFNLDI
jgi:uncharacterized protein (DUF1919 family)